ncbi:MAG: histidine phosphatase family protein [Armatimonadota bacterium]|nr:histidine phosphatase family protein [Armatimonadota bacterium]MDR7451497.1 histidine phosphatase family protein [Armatimonadota bacterium]MDR7467464.1 histidine phosphatase family protein [Armatimonadota bacterium]MDR7494338.1 histidine phosphatase family protein [Armatimonadota bacterium]MDR7499155.1 histidine phosphatase family protein [Armatimonadota bacterium]
MSAARLLLIRHGQSRWNAEGRLQGQLDVPLSALGERQAEALARRLGDLALAAVYASPLRRALATAEAIARPHGLPVRTVPEFIEIDHGAWQGRSLAEVAASDRDRLRLWTSVPGRVRMPGGERLFDVRQRALAAVAALAARHVGQIAAAVSHEVVIKVVVAEALGLDYDHLGRMQIDNAALTTVEYEGGRARLLTLNDTAHLADLEGRSKSAMSRSSSRR